MIKINILNPLDQQIETFATEFAKIPNYNRDMQDPDLKKVHTFIAVRLTGIHSTKKLLLEAFLPKTDELITKTKNQIRTSKYKQILDTVDFEVDEVRYETIRLGYVMVFHKYEVFIKDLFKLLDELSETYTETNESLEDYCKRRLSFNAKEWHKYPAVHQVNFISNCTKHQDGICKLDNHRFTKPIEFTNYPDNQKINRTTEHFKNDMKIFLETIKLLLTIVSYSNVLRTLDANVKATYSSGGVDYPLYDEAAKVPLNEQILQIEKIVRDTIDNYKEI